MDRMKKYVFGKYGRDIKITENGNTITAKGFVQPLHMKDTTYYNIKELQAGGFDNSHFFMITSGDVELSKTGGAIVECCGDKFITKLTGNYYIAKKKVYVWAVLAACTDAKLEDDYD